MRPAMSADALAVARGAGRGRLFSVHQESTFQSIRRALFSSSGEHFSVHQKSTSISHRRCDAAVDMEDSAVDEGRFLAQQKRNGVGVVVLVSQSPQRNRPRASLILSAIVELNSSGSG